MAAQSVLKLKVDSSEYNSKIQRATTGLMHLSKSLKEAGKSFSDADKDQVAYISELGKMQTVSNSARGRVTELTKAFVELAAIEKNLTEQEKQSAAGQALSKSLVDLKQRAMDAKQELAELNSQLDSSKSGIPSGGVGNIGGLLGGKGGSLGGMLQVFGGNLMTKAAGWVASFASEMGEVVQQSVELASQGEGIRNAFERLGSGDLLDGLREATHGTVTDLELMKAAVRFNDFNLPLEELGTMLAFAQQKAKDTGQSVDFLVESIVNGLGRQSTQILDNLGLSQAEVKKRTAETGDMTKAVGQIIREQMAAAGEYIETAADRAAKADVDLKNAMDDLGRTLLPLQEQGVSMWTSLKIGAVELLNEGLKPMVPAVVELKDSMSDMFDTVANSNAFSKLVSWMQESFDWAVRLIPVVNVLRDVMAGIGNKGLAGGASIGGALGNFMSYDAGQLPEVVVKAPRIRGGGGGGRTSRGGGRSTVTTPKVDEILPVGSVADLNNELSKLRKKQDLATDTAGWMAQQREIDKLTTKIKILKGQMPDPSNIQSAANGASITGESTFTVPKELHLDTGHIDNLVKKAKEMENAYKLAASAVSSIGDAFNSIEDPSAKAAGTVMQAIASIALGFAQAAAAKDTTASGWAWLGWLAAGAAAMATTISTIHSLTNLSEGGFVPGNSYSGDNIYGGNAMVNSGELVLNRSQQNNLANALQGGPQELKLHAIVKGDQLELVLNRSLKLRGKGEIVTWK